MPGVSVKLWKVRKASARAPTCSSLGLDTEKAVAMSSWHSERKGSREPVRDRKMTEYPAYVLGMRGGYRSCGGRGMDRHHLPLQVEPGHNPPSPPSRMQVE